MTRRINIDPTGVGVAINATQKIIVTVTWDNETEAITPNDQYTFDHDTDVTGTGVIKVIDPSGNGQLPVSVSFAIDLGTKSATASITVQGTTKGLYGIKGFLTKNPTLLITNCTLNVMPASVSIRYKDTPLFTNPIMPVTDQTYATLADVPPNLKSTVTYMAVDKDEPTRLAGPYCLVTIQLFDVRETPDIVSGIFYVNGVAISLSSTPPDKDAFINTLTDANSLVTLTVVSNAKDGYISCFAYSTGVASTPAYIYLYDWSKAASPSLRPPIYRGDDPLTEQTPATFPVDITMYDPNLSENLGLILNDSFQQQVPLNKFGLNPRFTATGQTLDLKTVDNPMDYANFNMMFYCVTDKGNLHNSIAEGFPVQGSQPYPQPTNQILSWLVQPTGLVINLGSIFNPDGTQRSIDAIMNVKSDVDILKNKMGLTLSTNQLIRLSVVAQGDYQKTGEFQVDYNFVDTPITAAMLTQEAVSITIPRDFIAGYGTPKDHSKVGKYMIWYGYVNATTDKNAFASSPITDGALATAEF